MGDEGECEMRRAKTKMKDEETKGDEAEGALKGGAFLWARSG